MPLLMLIFYAFVDADFAGCRDTRKSTTGFLVRLGGGIIAWNSSRQSCVTRSTAEAEFVAAHSLCRKLAEVRDELSELGFPLDRPTQVWENNMACIKGAASAKIADLLTKPLPRDRFQRLRDMSYV
jgi:hypothetical protein